MRRQLMFAVSSPRGPDAAVMDKAVCVASALDADLELFHCVLDTGIARSGVFSAHGAQEDIHQLVDLRHHQLEHNARLVRTRGVRVRSSVRWDRPVHEGIIRQVLRHHPDLLILQATRKGPVARRLLPRTDWKLIECCPCPVLVIKTERPYSDPCVIAALDPANAHHKPPVLDAAILDSASAISHALSGHLLVFHAQTPREDAVDPSNELRSVPEVVREDVRAAYRNGLARQITQFARDHATANVRVRIRKGYAAAELPIIAKSESAAIVAIGAASRSRLRRLLFGHTAERVLDKLDCDVLIVKPAGFRSLVRAQSVHRVARSTARPGHYVW